MNDRRRALAARYARGAGRAAARAAAPSGRARRHVYHLYVVRTPRRAELAAFLKARGIQTGIHYPVASTGSRRWSASPAPRPARDRAARGRDPDAADLRRPHRGRDRRGGGGGPRVLRSLMAGDAPSDPPDLPEGGLLHGRGDPAARARARPGRAAGTTSPSPRRRARSGRRAAREAGLAHAAIPMRRAWDPRAAWRLARLIRERAHPDRPRAQGPRAHAHPAGRAHGRPRAARPQPRRQLPGRRACGRVGYTSRRVHAIVAVCESIKRGLVAAGVPADKIEVIYSGTDLERFHPGVDGGAVRRELGLAPDALRSITQIGVRSWRGWRDVLDGDARACRAAAPRARLLFVGAPPPRVARDRRARARARPRRPRARRSATATTCPAILAASDVVVDASYAGLGITGSIREALACERPVVATDAGGHAGAGARRRDRAAGAAARRRPRSPRPSCGCSAIRRAAQTMARAGRKRVEAHFSLRAKLDATEALYRRLVGRGRGVTHAARPSTAGCCRSCGPTCPCWSLGALLALVVAAMEGAIAWLVKPALDDIFIRRDADDAADHPAAAARRLPGQGRSPATGSPT